MDIVIPVLVLLAVLVVAGVGFRMITQRGGSDQDASSNFPNQETRDERPLGDTPEAHDELNPHDLPLDHPGREEAEQAAGGAEGTTRGPLAGG